VTRVQFALMEPQPIKKQIILCSLVFLTYTGDIFESIYSKLVPYVSKPTKIGSGVVLAYTNDIFLSLFMSLRTTLDYIIML